MITLKFAWLLLAAYTNANALSNEIEDDDTSIEDPTRPRQPFYDVRNDLDDTDLAYWKKKEEKKPTISENAIFLPHEKFCQYFYAFDGTDSYVFRCASGYRFDSEKLQCLKSKYVHCGKRKKDVGSSEEKHVGINFKCLKWSGVHPHPHYCHLFFNCQSKKPSLVMCPPGRLFDKKTSKCLVWNKVDCAKRDNPYEGYDLDDTSHPDTNSDKTFNCADPAGVYPDLEHCNRFIRCWYGFGEYYVCPKGKLYDEDLQKCRSKDSVYCDNRFNPYARKDEKEPTLVDLNPSFNCKTYNGRFPHEDCRQFYECEYGHAKLFMCPEGTLYDKDSSSCKDESSVTCGKNPDEELDDEFVCPARDGIFKDEDNCGFYYKCRNGKALHIQCPEGELFDTDWKSCNDANDITCGDRLLPGDEEEEEEETVVDKNPSYNCEQRHGRFTHTDYCNWFYHCKDSKPNIRSCKRGKYYDSKKQKCYPEVDCGNRKIKEDDETTTPQPKEFTCPTKTGKFPNPKDCGSYYVCEKYKHKHHVCPKGKLFHDKFLSCVNEESVSCGNRIHPEVDPEDVENKVIDPNPKFECKTNYGQFQHDDYCDWYYNCHDKKSTLRECKRGKYYDRQRRKCFHSKEVSCDHRKRPEDREFPTTTEKVLTTKEPEFQCPQSYGKFPHWRDCSKYFECKKWTYRELKCPKYKLFDARRQSCEDDDHVICDDRIHPDMDPDEPEDKVIDPNPKFECRNNYGRFTHNEYCHWYYNCHNRKASVRECKRGKYYDSKRRKCYDTREVTCDERKKPKDDESKRTTFEDLTTVPTVAPVFQCPKKDGIYPHERDCGKFFDCKQWKHKVRDCPKKKLFNEKTKKCDPEDKVTCGLRIHPDDDPDEPEDEIVDKDPDFSCPSYHGRYKHRYCHRYFHCRDRRPTTRECRYGKYYDQNRKRCKSSDDVDCDDRIKPEEKTTYRPVSTTTSQPTSTTVKEKSTIAERPVTETTKTSEVLSTTTSYPSTQTSGLSTKISDSSSTTSFPSTQTSISSTTTTSYPSTKTSGTSQSSTQTSSSSTTTPESPKTTSEATNEPTTEEKPVTETRNFECLEDGTFPHPSNCGKYYLCVNGNTEEKLCPEGQLYDVDKRACNEEEETNCDSRRHPKDNPEDPVLDPNPDFNCTEKHGCFTHEVFCKWYYYCHDKRPEVRECSGDQYFDSVRNKCLDWWMVFCDNRIVPEGTTFYPSIATRITTRSTSGGKTDVTGVTVTKEARSTTGKDDLTSTTIERLSTGLTGKTGDESSDSTNKMTKITGEGKVTPSSTVEDQSTASSGTDSTKARTLNTDSDRETRTTDDSSDKITDMTGNTDNTKQSRSTTESLPKTTPREEQPSKTGVTDGAKETGSTADRGRNTRSSPSGRVTITTEGKSEGTRNTDRETHSTREHEKQTTPNGINTGSTEGRTSSTGMTDKSRHTSYSTESDQRSSTTPRDRNTRSSPSGRVTITTEGKTGKTRNTDKDKETRSTREHEKKTTPNGINTGSTEGRTSSTGITDNSRQTRYSTESDQRSSTTPRDRNTRSSPSGRVTITTEGKTGETRNTDKDKETRSTREHEKKTTPRGKSTGSTEGRTGGTGITDNNRQTTYSTKNDQRSSITPKDKPVSSSTEETGSTFVTNIDVEKLSTQGKDQNIGSTSNDRSTVSEDGNTGGTLFTKDSTGTSSTKKKDEHSKTTPNDISTSSTAGRTGTEPDQDKVTSLTTRKDGITVSTTKGTGSGSTEGITGKTELELRTTNGVYTTDKPISEKCKEEDGDFHHPDDCSKFYICKDGEYTVNDCPEGTLFDQNMRICYKESLVDCGNRKKPGVTTETLDDCDEWLLTRTTPADDGTTNTSESTNPSDKGTLSTDSTAKQTKGDETSTPNNDASTPDNDKSTTPSSSTLSDRPSEFTSDSTQNDTSINSTMTIVIEDDPTTTSDESKITESSLTPDSSSVPTSTKDNEQSTVSTITTDDTSENSTKEIVTKIQPTEKTSADTEENTEIPTSETSISDQNRTTADDKEIKKTAYTVGNNSTKETTEDEEITNTPAISTTESSNNSTDIKTDATEKTSVTVKDNTDTSSTSSTVTASEEMTSTVDIVEPDFSTESTRNTDGEISSNPTQKITNTENDNSRSTTTSGNKTSNDSSDGPTEGTTEDGFETRVISVRTPAEPESTMSFSTKDTTEISSTTENSKTEDERTKHPDTSSNDDSRTEPYTGTQTVTEPTSTITNPDDDKISKQTSTDDEISKETTTDNEPSSTITNPDDDKISKQTSTDDEISKEITTDNEPSSTITNPDDDKISKQTSTDDKISKETTTDNEPSSTITNPDDDKISKQTSTDDKISKETTTDNEPSSTITNPDDDKISKQTSTDDEISKETTTDNKPSSTITNPDDDKISKQTSTDDEMTKLTTTDDKILKETTTDGNLSTNSDSKTTHQHTTMHPCLTHTHSTHSTTTNTPEPTKIDCDNDDIDCIEKKTGNVEKWYTCPKKEGDFPHPYSDRIFIRCRGWKPKLKHCGRHSVFSPKYLKCVR